MKRVIFWVWVALHVALLVFLPTEPEPGFFVAVLALLVCCAVLGRKLWQGLKSAPPLVRCQRARWLWGILFVLALLEAFALWAASFGLISMFVLDEVNSHRYGIVMLMITAVPLLLTWSIFAAFAAGHAHRKWKASRMLWRDLKQESTANKTDITLP